MISKNLKIIVKTVIILIVVIIIGFIGLIILVKERDKANQAKQEKRWLEYEQCMSKALQVEDQSKVPMEKKNCMEEYGDILFPVPLLKSPQDKILDLFFNN